MLLFQIQIPWVGWACLMLLLLGLAPVFAKAGLEKMEAPLAAALWGIPLLLWYYIMAESSGIHAGFSDFSLWTWIFLVLAGIAAGASWICGFKALQMCFVNRAAPMAHLGQVFVSLAAFFVFHKGMVREQWFGLAMILAGILLIVIGGTSEGRKINSQWWIFSLLASVFTVLSYIICALGTPDVPKPAQQEVQTAVALVMAWVLTLCSHKRKELKSVTLYHALLLLGSALALVFGNICSKRAMAVGDAGVVTVMAQFPLAVSLLLSRIFLKERLSNRGLVGLLVLLGGLCVLHLN